MPAQRSRYPWATNEQLRANDAFPDSLLPPELYEEKQRQLRELCRPLKEARAAEARPPA